MYIRAIFNIVHIGDVTAGLNGHVAMDEQDSTEKKAQSGLSRKIILLINVLAVIVAIICFVIVAVWLESKKPFFDAPLRSILTGFGLLCLSFPLFTAGFIFQKKAALSPYYEEAFIRTAFYIVGFVCLFVGLICIGLSIYALIMRFFGEG